MFSSSEKVLRLETLRTSRRGLTAETRARRRFLQSADRSMPKCGGLHYLALRPNPPCEGETLGKLLAVHISVAQWGEMRCSQICRGWDDARITTACLYMESPSRRLSPSSDRALSSSVRPRWPSPGIDGYRHRRQTLEDPHKKFSCWSCATLETVWGVFHPLAVSFGS